LRWRGARSAVPTRCRSVALGAPLEPASSSSLSPSAKPATRSEHQDLASLIDLYLLRCQVEGKSPNTITAYRETLTLFERIAREEGFPEGVRAIAPVHCSCPDMGRG